MNVKVWVVFAGLFFVENGFASTLEKFVNLLQPYRSFSGEFVQIMEQSNNSRKRVINGRIAISGRTHLFWETDKPFQQKIIADGEYIWVYDEDLMQVQVRSLEESFVSSPFKILVGTPDEISKDFSVIEKKMNLKNLFILEPKSSDQLTLRIECLFDREILRELTIISALGSSIRLIMQSHSFTSLDMEIFKFEPPPDVDIVYPQD